MSQHSSYQCTPCAPQRLRAAVTARSRTTRMRTLPIRPAVPVQIPASPLDHGLHWCSRTGLWKDADDRAPSGHRQLLQLRHAARERYPAPAVYNGCIELDRAIELTRRQSTTCQRRRRASASNHGADGPFVSDIRIDGTVFGRHLRSEGIIWKSRSWPAVLRPDLMLH